MTILTKQTTVTTSTSKAALSQSPATMALRSLIGAKRNVATLKMASDSTLADTSSGLFDFPTIEWLDNDENHTKTATTTKENQIAQGVHKCLEQAFRLAQDFDDDEQPKKKRRRLNRGAGTTMVRCSAVPCSLASLAPAPESPVRSLHPLQPLALPLALPLSSPTTSKGTGPNTSMLLPALFREKSMKMTLSSSLEDCPFPKPFKSASRNYTLNCRVSPLA